MAFKDWTETVGMGEKVRSVRTETVSNNETITCSWVKVIRLGALSAGG